MAMTDDVGIVMPDGLAALGYRLRDEREDDLTFLQALYASTRADEMTAIAHWSAEQASAFLIQQFTAQHHHYRTQISHCRFFVIERCGTSVGRLYLQFRPTQIRVVDIALLPDVRNQGVGSALLAGVIETAAAPASVGIFVDRGSPALRLYRRLGFERIGETAFHIEMVRVTHASHQPNTAS